MIVLCGNCDGNRENDFMVISGLFLEEIWWVFVEDSFFIYNYGDYKEEWVVIGVEYVFKFKWVGVFIDLIFEVFYFFVISVEFLFKIFVKLNFGGVFFIYSKIIMLMLFIEVNLKVWIGVEVWDIGFFLEIEVWN